MRRQAVRLAVVAALGAVLWAAHSSPAGASCVGPALTVSPATVAPGDTIEIRGERFGTGCNDTGGPGPVLGEPAHDIVLHVVQGDTVIRVARVDAQPDYTFDVRVTTPPSLQPGAAMVGATHSSLAGPPARFSVIAPTASVSPTTLTPTSLHTFGYDIVERDGGQSPVVPFALGLGAAAVIAAAVVGSRLAGSRRA